MFYIPQPGRYLTQIPPAARSVEELFSLIEFCKAGDLKAVSDWIAKGNPLDLPPGKKTRRESPLQIAIEKGFLTLTETLPECEADPSEKLFQRRNVAQIRRVV